MADVKLVLKRIQDPFCLMFEYPKEPYKTKLNQILERCTEKTNDYVTLTISRPYKPRTTGKDSQNSLVWKLIQIIAEETGEEVEEVERYVKMKAISRGYPFHVNKLTGEPCPESMKKINTVECSYLIETLYEVIAFLGIVLEPELKPTVFIQSEPVKDEEKEETSSLVEQALFEGDIF